MPEAPEVKWMFMVVVIGALYLSKKEKTSVLSRPGWASGTQPLSGVPAANSREFSKHNLDRYNRLSPLGKLFENITPWFNASDVSVGRLPAGKAKQGL